MSIAQGDARSGDPVVVIGAGPAGLTAAYELVKAGDPVVVAEADDVVGGISRTVRARRAGASTSAVTASSPRSARSRTSGTRSCPTRTSCCGRGRAASSTRASTTTTRSGRINALRNLGPFEAVLCGLSYLWAQRPAAQGPDQLRGLAGGPLRLAPLPHLLQDLHREGVGGPGLRDAGRLGRPAGEEPRPRQGDHQRAHPQAQPDRDHHPHRGVPLPEVRARDDVGGLPREGGGRRRRRADGDQGPRHPRRSTGGPRRSPLEHAGQSVRQPASPRDLVDADRRAGRGASTRRRRPRCWPRPATCTTGTSSPWRSSCRRSSGSPTTGSTCTRPTSRWAGSRTSARGRRTW